MYEKDDNKYKITQGDIFQSFTYVRWAEFIEGNIDIDEITIPYFVVLSQSCDLEHDFEDRNKPREEKRDKYIQSILVCPAYLAESVKAGEHLKGLNLIMETYNSKRWKQIKENNNARYHFLEKNETIGLPNLVIDFKQYYTIPTYSLYKLHGKHYVSSLKPLFRENLSHRFAFYLSRIGLPIIKEEDF